MKRDEPRLYGGCPECGSVINICPNCGYCDEHHADGIVDKMVNASPETLQSATAAWIKRGGKWEALARFLMGEGDAFDRYEAGDFGPVESAGN
jgi:hypothetical protein